MLFVLSTLLGCKRKNEIQNHLAKQGIIAEMNRYFEYNEWGNIFEENPRPFFNNQEINYSDDTAFHGEGCKCDQEVGFKVQFLRFIYSFCCRDNDNIDNKLSMLSKSDLEDTFSNSFFYFFYSYMYMNKLRISAQPAAGKLSSFADNIFRLEGEKGSLFSVFFDFIEFEKLIGKVNDFSKQLGDAEVDMNKEENEIENDSNKDKDLIYCEDGGNDVQIIEETKENNCIENSGNVNNNNLNINLNPNCIDLDLIYKGNHQKNKQENEKNVMFTTTKISKNHFNKGSSGNR